ncbi:MAG: hypothetical protein KC421_14365 [Anaerolineales bacterium]|nr:hypothetical protein [Anaerolineales bacterium]
MKHKYNFQNVRTLLLNGFSMDEIMQLCFDLSEFMPFYQQINPEASKIQTAHLLIDYANRRELVDALLSWCKKHNPSKYQIYEPYYASDIHLVNKFEESSMRFMVAPRKFQKALLISLLVLFSANIFILATITLKIRENDWQKREQLEFVQPISQDLTNLLDSRGQNSDPAITTFNCQNCHRVERIIIFVPESEGQDYLVVHHYSND